MSYKNDFIKQTILIYMLNKKGGISNFSPSVENTKFGCATSYTKASDDYLYIEQECGATKEEIVNALYELYHDGYIEPAISCIGNGYIEFADIILS